MVWKNENIYAHNSLGVCFHDEKEWQDKHKLQWIVEKMRRRGWKIKFCSAKDLKLIHVCVCQLYHLRENMLSICFRPNLLKADNVNRADLPSRKQTWGNMNSNGGRHHYEGYCVSWKAECISRHANSLICQVCVWESNAFGCSSCQKKKTAFSQPFSFWNP